VTAMSRDRWQPGAQICYLLGDLPREENGSIIVDQKTLQLLRSGAQLVDQYGAPLKPS